MREKVIRTGQLIGLVVALVVSTMPRGAADTRGAVERELKWLVSFFTHRVSPSVAGFLAPEPRKSRREN